MEVRHQKPCSGLYGALAKVFESHDYYLKSVCRIVNLFFQSVIRVLIKFGGTYRCGEVGAALNYFGFHLLHVL